MIRALYLLSVIFFLVAGLLQAANIVLAVLGGCLLLVLIYVVNYSFIYIREFLSNNQRPPIGGPIFNQLIHFNDLFDYQTLLARRYSTYRLIVPTHSEIYTADPVNIEYILKTNFSNYGKGKYNCGIMRDLFGDGIFAVDGEKWRQQRKLASYEFSTKVLKDFSTSIFLRNAVKLIMKISAVAGAKQIIDMQDLLMKSTLDLIFKVGFGVELNTLSGLDDSVSSFTKAFDDSNAIVYWRYVDILWKVKRFLNVGLEASLKRNLRTIDEFIFELICHKKEQLRTGMIDSGKEDILSRFLIDSENDPEKMTDKYLRDITLNFIIAGRDTSANTLTWFFYILCKHPYLQDKVAHDVRRATGSEDNISAEEFVESMTEEALDRMHYLHAALTETLRLYPAVPVDGKCASADDILPDGFKVKKGDGVNYLTYAMGRMTYVWGDDAETFHPERWLEDRVFRPESPFKFTAFQAGPRICLGKEFAYRQMKILAALLVYFFKFNLVDEKEATYRTMFTLHMDGGLHLHALPRF
ncbi:cytochrome P450 704C1 [Eucalyptus grandis]|uniref:cytochrome P450 704C1 n=1 Tax=Eucalyptus grandis TaxID=71139 RepID=UPI00192F02F4|nr:cytochrome P450 704C1 [Eucalyptus grandis]